MRHSLRLGGPDKNGRRPHGRESLQARETWWGRIQHRGKEHRRSLGTTARDIAEKRVKAWIESLEAEEWGETPPLLFDAAAEAFIEEHLPTIKPSSAKRYISSLRKMLPHMRGLRLDKIDRTKLTEYVAYRKREGASQPTIRRDLACLSSLWEHAAGDHDIETANPILRFLKAQSRRGALKESPPRTRYLSHQEEAALLTGCTDPTLADQIACAIDTGLRQEEMFGLTWRDVDLRSGVVTVIADRAKSGKARQVPLLERSAQILAQMPRRLRPAGGPDWVFCDRKGNRYKKRRRAFETACRRAGIEGLTWHDLRRTCGCRLLQDREFAMDRVKSWLGHSTVAMTERSYAFLEIDDLKRAAQIPAHGQRTT